jgi:hypothetical protein
MKKIIILWNIFLFLFAAKNVWAKDDFQYRQLLTVKMVDTEKVDFSVFSQMRMNHDAQDINFFLVSPQLKFDAWKNLALGINYSYVNLKGFNPAAGRDEFKIHHRCELEVDPHWTLGDWLEIQTRNRYEFRWIEDQGSDNPRIRHRTNLEFPLKNVLPVQSVYMNSEFFYDVNDHRYNENWTVPLGVKFKVNKKTSLSIFYMIQSRLTDDWTTSQILGTNVFVKF